jgi:exonuclease SbcC
MVISHLHAVAEAVDDVLWVERGIAGSTARC